jgi:membrane fusion protein (multidrug efflux system)
MYREQNQDTNTNLPALFDNPARQSELDRSAAGAHSVGNGVDAEGEARVPRRGLRLNKRMLLASAIAVAMLGGGFAGVRWWLNSRYIVSTDDAYVFAHNRTLASKISGYVDSIPVQDNARVRAGDVIATIDDGDYRLAVDAARDKVATQQATVDRIGRQIIAQGANVDQANAQMVSAKANAKRMQLEFERQQALAGQKFASQQTLEQSEANRDQAVAAVQSAQATIDAAKDNLDVLSAQRQEGARTLEELKTAQAQAERNLSFTVIRAPVDGVFGNRAVQTGDYVQIGQRIASLVPLSDVYIDANFKETQLARIRPGQSVSISIDALPGDTIKGRVASLSPASGSVFSLLPPDNATGNFTKIVQRLPVRIEVPSTLAAQHLLRPGMSVVVGVDTQPGHSAEASLTSAAEAAEANPGSR